MIIYVDFTHIATSNAANEDVTNYVTHRTFNSDLLCTCVHFIVKIGEKFSINGAF